MIKRYRHWLGEEARHMVETFDGEYVLYTDHLAAMSELKDQGQAIVDRYEERLKEKDKEIARLRNSHEMKFVRHIEAHLSAYQVPICKICGKDIFEISEEDSDEIQKEASDN